MQPPPMSARLAAAIKEVPGAKAAYLTNAHSKMWIEALDTHWEAVVDAVHMSEKYSEVVADRYVRIMLAKYVTFAEQADRVHAETVRTLERTAKPPIIGVQTFDDGTVKIEWGDREVEHCPMGPFQYHVWNGAECQQCGVDRH